MSLSMLIFVPLLSGAQISRPVGTNLAQVKDYSTEFVFTDAFRQCRKWITFNADGSGPWETGLEVPACENGYPLQVPFTVGESVPQKVRTLMLWGIGSAVPTGEYRLIVEGTGQVTLLEGASGTFDCPVDTYVHVTGGVQLAIDASHVNDPISKIQFVYPNYTETFQTKTFTDELVDFLSDFQVLRFMDWLRTNGSEIENWGQRSVADYFTQTKSSGVAWEYIVELCNTTKKDAWINIPHKATDDYISELAIYLKTNLNPDLKVYIEYSNELWNSSFAQYTYAVEQATTLGYDGQNWEKGWKYTAKRSADIFKIFETVYGSSASLVKVIPSQAGNDYVAHKILSYFNDPFYNPNEVTADALAIAPYFAHNVANDIVNEGLVSTITVPEIVDRMENVLATTYTWMTNNQARANTYNVKLITYEGGQHLVGSGGNENNDELTTKLIAANRHPDLKDTYKQYLNHWYENHGELFVHFTSEELYTKWGSWGLKEFIDDFDNPKYVAMQESVFNYNQSGVNNALHFDGLDNYLNFSTSNSPSYSNTEISIEAWINTSGGQGIQTILAWGNSNAADASNVRFQISNGYLQFGMQPDGGAWQQVAGNQPVEDDEWVHVAVAKNGNLVTLYLNGMETGAGTLTHEMTVDAMTIGVNDAGAEFFSGSMDEIRVWSVARTDDQIRRLMCRSLVGNEENLLAFYNLDRMGGTIVSDISGNGFEGEMINMNNSAWNESEAFNTWLGYQSESWENGMNWSLGKAPFVNENLGIYDWNNNNPVIPNDNTLSNLVVGENVAAQVAAGNNLTVGRNLHVFGELTIQSTGMGADATGSLIVEGDATGQIHFQRYADVFDKGEKWHYISAPVAGQEISTSWTNANSIGFADPAWQFFRWDEDTRYWIYFDYQGNEPEDFGDDIFVDARGYCLSRTESGALLFTGDIRTTDVLYPATFTLDKGNGWNLVGNPFTSSIGITQNATSAANFLAENATLLDENYSAIYIWDEQSSFANYRNDYKIISNAAIEGYTQIGQHYIQPGQAFMAKVVSSGDLSFTKNMQAHAGVDFYKSDEMWPSVELMITGNGNVNTTAIGFNDEMTAGLDPSYDVGKFKGNPDLAVYTRLIDDNGKDFAIQALPMWQVEEFVIAVGVDISTPALYEFSATYDKFDNYNITLEDRELEIFTNLRWENYQAEISKSGPGRFYLHFKDATGMNEKPFNSKISILLQDGKIVILNPDREIALITVVNILGQVVFSAEMNGEDTQEINFSHSNGMFIFGIQTKGEKIAKKLFLNNF